MDLDRLAPVLEDIIKRALAEPVYRFGLPRQKGVANKVSSGELYNSVEARSHKFGVDIHMNKYWRHVQRGRMPGKRGVPIAALEEWIDQRRIRATDDRGRPLPRKSLAFAIQTHIKKFGIPSDPGFLDRAIEIMYADKELEEILAEITVDELLDKIQGL